MLNRFLTIAAFTTLGFGLGAAAPAGAASLCGPWGCGLNGTQLDGIAVQGATLKGIPSERTEVVLRKELPARDRVLESKKTPHTNR